MSGIMHWEQPLDGEEYNEYLKSRSTKGASSMNNDTLKFRLPSKLKQTFAKVCNANVVKQSEVLRKFIEEYVEEGKNG